MILLFRYLGPTDHRGPRWKVSAYGYKPVTFHRLRYEVSPSEEMEKLAVRYVESLFRDIDTSRRYASSYKARYLGQINDSDYIVLVEEETR